jgi:hypothetical protein
MVELENCPFEINLKLIILMQHHMLYLILEKALSTDANQNDLTSVLSRVLVTATGFGLIIRFINHSQVVTTINYDTVPNFYITKTERIRVECYLHLPSPSNGSQHRNYHRLTL